MSDKVCAMWMESMLKRGGRLVWVASMGLCLGACEGDGAVRSSIVEGRMSAQQAQKREPTASTAPQQDPPADRAKRAHPSPLVVTPPASQEVAQGVVVMLHGYNSNHLDFKDVAALAASQGLVAISVPAPNASAPMRFQWERDDVEGTHAYVQSVLHEALESELKGLELKRPVKIWLMGFSQGGMYAAILS